MDKNSFIRWTVSILFALGGLALADIYSAGKAWVRQMSFSEFQHVIGYLALLTAAIVLLWPRIRSFYRVYRKLSDAADSSENSITSDEMSKIVRRLDSIEREISRVDVGLLDHIKRKYDREYLESRKRILMDQKEYISNLLSEALDKYSRWKRNDVSIEGQDTYNTAKGDVIRNCGTVREMAGNYYIDANKNKIFNDGYPVPGDNDIMSEAYRKEYRYLVFLVNGANRTIDHAVKQIDNEIKKLPTGYYSSFSKKFDVHQ